jgi:hypothetical protein
MNRTVITAALVLMIALTAAAAGLASSSRTAGTLELEASLKSKYRFGDYCPPSAPPLGECVRFTAEGPASGLGATTVTYTKVVTGELDCPVIQFSTAVFAVAGKGELELSRSGKACGPTAPASVGPLTYTVTRGTGIYQGASGTLQFTSYVATINLSCRCGAGSDKWTGTLTVPDADFDVVAPTLTGGASKTVRVRKNARRVRVRYTVTANDAVDGQVPVVCTPSSGSWFRLGRTLVACTASDTSGNAATARFTVDVKRARA